MVAERGRAAHPAPFRCRGSQRLPREGCPRWRRSASGAALRIEVEAPDGARRLMLADRLPRPGVEDRHGAVLVAGGEHAAVGADRERGDSVAVAVENADRRGAAQEGREQAGAAREGVVEGDARCWRDEALDRGVPLSRASAPRRRASATMAASRALWRSENAIAPAITAAVSRTPTPASNAVSLRFVWRWRSASRSLAVRLSSRKVRSSSFSSGAWLAAQSSAAASRAPR